MADQDDAALVPPGGRKGRAKGKGTAAAAAGAADAAAAAGAGAAPSQVTDLDATPPPASAAAAAGDSGGVVQTAPNPNLPDASTPPRASQARSAADAASPAAQGGVPSTLLRLISRPHLSGRRSAVQGHPTSSRRLEPHSASRPSR